MIVVLFLSITGVAAALVYYAGATAVALRYARRAPGAAQALPKVPPRLAVLKPLHGLGSTLAENLASFLENDYPRSDFFFGVSNCEDRAADAAAAVKSRYPFATVTLVVGEEPDCQNHKVAKLIRMVRRAEGAELFALSDADVRVEPDHLRRLVGELSADERTGLVTCLYRACPLSSLGARFEALFVNTDFAPMVLISHVLEPMRHALGAALAVKRAALEAIGGFEALKDLLADDFYIGRRIAEAGFAIRLSTSLVTVMCEERDFAQFWRHQLRWARTYRTVRPLSLATILIHGPFWALVLLGATGASALGWGALALVIGARLAMGAVVMARVLGLPGLCADLWLLPVKDLVMTGIWFASLLGNTVRWGGRRFRLLGGGAMREVGG